MSGAWWVTLGMAFGVIVNFVRYRRPEWVMRARVWSSPIYRWLPEPLARRLRVPPPPAQPDPPSIYDPSPYMIVTPAPRGAGDPPARAIKAVRHPTNRWPEWDVDERGWPRRYRLIPIGYVVDAKGSIVRHENPLYNGATQEGEP